jgi:uncharacterized protein
LLYDHHVYILPWRSVKPAQYQINVRVMRFDAVPGETVILNAHWVVLEESTRQILLEQESQIQLPLYSKDYNDLVAVQSQALGELSRDIAEAIHPLSE